MKVHKLLCAGAAFALLGVSATAEETDGFFAGLKLRGSVQATSREDNLMPVYMGFGLECGYQFSFGRLSAEFGYMYQQGRQYLDDLTKMENQGSSPIDIPWSVDSRKNQLSGVTLRLAYEKPLDKFLLRGGLQLGGLKFRQEYVALVDDEDGTFGDAYNGVIDQGNLSVSPFVGISFPFLTHHFLELNLVGLNYKSIDYVHVAGTVEDWGSGHTSKDRIAENSRMIPHLELTFGFRF
ncbi:MAG: hypothetical protein FWG12_01330 [Holophagaceae bacterium]|nr:hypothetical protein [Holophagaceae bacterium]